MNNKLNNKKTTKSNKNKRTIMKMRGYSVLFVCALCVFVLCGAAAVVAQEATPEKMAAEAAKGVAKTAKEKGETALKLYRRFESFVGFSAYSLSLAINAMRTSKRTADALSLPGQVPSKEEIKLEIWRLGTAMMGVKNSVSALKVPDADSLSNWGKEYELNKMADIENKTTEAEQAAAAVTDEIPTIDAVIEKADELEEAAKKAGYLWHSAARGKLTAQLGELDAVVAALNKTKNDIEEAIKKFANNTSPEIIPLNEQLTDISAFSIPSTLERLFYLKSLLADVKDAAEDVKNMNTALAVVAEELKGKAEERKRKVQIQHRLQQI